MTTVVLKTEKQLLTVSPALFKSVAVSEVESDVFVAEVEF